MATKYYTLVLDFGTTTHGWCDEFGATTRAECLEEWEFAWKDTPHACLGGQDWSKKHMKIIVTDGSKKALEEALYKLNEGYRAKQLEGIKRWRQANDAHIAKKTGSVISF